MKTILLVLLVAFSATTKAQFVYGIVNSYAFWQPNYSGTIPDDEPHKRGDSLFTVYLEIKKNVMPVWKGAIVAGKKYQVIQTKRLSPVHVGILQNQEDSTVLYARKSTRIWQLVFKNGIALPQKGKMKPAEELMMSVKLLGNRNHQSISYRVSPVKALQPVLYE